MTQTVETRSIQTLPVIRAEAFTVISGVAEGDALSFADELMLDDIYGLEPGTPRAQLVVALEGESRTFEVMAETQIGTPGNTVHLDCCLTFMSPDGTTSEALVLVEVEDEAAAAIYLLPLAALEAKTDYRLVGINRTTATTRFAEVACVSFTRGTHITLASGAQVRIEKLKVGDRVLTRDDGPQAIRWIGHSTLRAVGEFAPVMIRKGALNNANDLILSPDHRIFVYQRQDHIGAGRAEVLIKVRHLINGTSVVQQEGGFVDYFQLLFDDHQIIYAEGIAAESLWIDPRTKGAVPSEVSRLISDDGPGHAHRQHLDYEVRDQLMTEGDAVDLLRRASTS